MSLTLPGRFAAAVARFQDRPALQGEDGRVYSYAELDLERRRAARALLALGVQPQARIAVWAENSSEWVIAALAIISVGAVLVPVNTRMRGPEVAYVLERSEASLLFCAGRFLGQYFPAQLDGLRPASLKHLVVLGTPERGDRSG